MYINISNTIKVFISLLFFTSLYFIIIDNALTDSANRRCYEELKLLNSKNLSISIDPWGNKYNQLLTSDAQQQLGIIYYSNGRDGVSISGGFDKDDINLHLNDLDLLFMTCNPMWFCIAIFICGMCISCLWVNILQRKCKNSNQEQ